MVYCIIVWYGVVLYRCGLVVCGCGFGLVVVWFGVVVCGLELVWLCMGLVGGGCG